MSLWLAAVCFSVGLVQASPPTRTSNALQSRSSSVVEFTFAPIPNITTCIPTYILWNYTGPTTAHLALSAASDTYGTVGFEVDLDPTAERYLWQSPNATEGAYRLVGAIDQTLFVNALFNIQNGSDVSCLASSAIASGSAGTKTTPTVSAAGSTMSALRKGSHHRSKLERGAITGGIVGGFIAILLILFLLWRRRRRARIASRNRSLSSPFGSFASPGAREETTVAAFYQRTLVEARGETRTNKAIDTRDGLTGIHQQNGSRPGVPHGASPRMNGVHAPFKPAKPAHLGAVAGRLEDTTPTRPVSEEVLPNRSHLVEQMQAMAERLALLEARTRADRGSADGLPAYSSQ
ncbi:hypothetical protein C8R46DRAFT_1364583 [Mycena filopes]|nr:hypothetical protein C8R46DRAFT_1364583 [Mycena filopes]